MRIRTLFVSLACLVALFIIAPAAVHAGTIIKVTTTLDDLETNGNCTLREAIIAANTDGAVDACPAGSGADTIILRSGSYRLSLLGPGEDAGRTGDLDVTSDVTIRGTSAAVSIIDAGVPVDPLGAMSDRVIHVLSGHITLSRVTIRGGVCVTGAGIFNAGHLLIEDSRVVENYVWDLAACGSDLWGGGAGIFNLGDLTVSRSTVSANVVTGTITPPPPPVGLDQSLPGGGLLNRGRARIERSLFTRNRAAAGGAIENFGELLVADSEIRENFSRFWAGGLQSSGASAVALLERTTVSGNSDGGLVNGGLNPGDGAGTMVLRNSTVSGNYSTRVAGSVINWSGSLEIVSSTIADNQSPSSSDVAGIGGFGTPVQLLNTIVSNQPGSNCVNAVASLGHNLDSDGTCGLTRTDDLSGIDPQLGPLADNGGFTRTHALLAGSPALDRIPKEQCGVLTDQRGIARPQPPKGGLCDIGSYEFSPAGEINLILDEVMGLQLTDQQQSGLTSWLKLAWGDVALISQPAHACVMLDAFKTNVSSYASDGLLLPEVAQSLLGDAVRVQGLLCP